jgi:hypothetical protein
LKRKGVPEGYSAEQSQAWAEHWLQRLRRLPRVVTPAEIDSLKLLIFGSGQPWGIADGAARIRYLVGSKLISNFTANDQTDDHLENALTQVIAEGELASEELAVLAPGLLVGVPGQREPSFADLRRMGLEYKAGFALSPLTIHFCEMYSIKDGQKLMAAIDDEITRPDFLNTVRMITSGRSGAAE